MVSAGISLLSVANGNWSQRTYGWTRGPLFLPPEESALVPCSTDLGFFRQTAPVFPQPSQGLGVAGNKFQSFIAWNFLEKVYFSFLRFYICHLKKNLNLKSLVVPVGWLPFLPSWLWWPCFLWVHWHSFFYFKCDYCSPSLSHLQCVRSLPSTKGSLAPHFDSL